MAMLGSSRIHIVFMDSRGDGLQELIDSANNTGEHFEVDFLRGATFGDLVDKVDAYLPTHPFDVIYLAGGVNDITTKNRQTNLISYRWGQGDDLKNYLVKILKSANAHLKKNHPASKIVFCPLPGSELSRIVSEHKTSEEDQQAVEEAIWEFNSVVFEINAERGTVCPSLHHQIHRFCKGTRRAYYHHLADGIHLTQNLREKWAKQFIKVMTHN